MDKLDEIIDRNATEPKKISFVPLDKLDLEMWSGCESDEPLIHTGKKLIVIIDGSRVFALDQGTGDHGEHRARNATLAAIIACKTALGDELVALDCAIMGIA